MSFTSINFIIFFIIVYIVLIFLKCFKLEYDNLFVKIILLASCYILISLVDIRFLICIFLFTILSYMISVFMMNTVINRKKYLILGIILCVVQLGIFKYFNFFIVQIHNIFSVNFHILNIFLPIGISFYTFSAISYLVDGYNNKFEKTIFLDYAIYLSFFPKLNCGPIVKFKRFIDELNGAKITYNNFEVGIQIFVIGLFKKMVLADHISIFVDDIFNYTNAFSSITVLIGVFSYSLQIYFDFSGYSDIAIGLSKVLGFNFDNNFNLPYISKNPSEFWKRWHISLSMWLQEYVYIPLGGNRCGIIKKNFNLFLTMLIGGLWHGANWTFIVWGAINGIALIVHKVYSGFRKKYFSFLSKNVFYKTICMIFTFLFITFCWIFFRSSDINEAFNIIKILLSNRTGLCVYYSWTFLGIAVLLLEMFVAKKQDDMFNFYYPHLKLNKISHLTLFLVFCGLTIIMAYVGETQFIYGNF